MSEEKPKKADAEESDEAIAIDPCAQVQAELDRAKSDYLYLRAEFDNYRKNMIKERADLARYGSENLIRELVNLLDVVETAANSEITATNLDTFRKGLQLVFSEFKNVLGKFGVREENPQGQAFDPNSHEALSSEETTEFPPGHISRVFKKAYRLHEKMVRPAQVIVAKEPSAGSKPDSES